MIKRKSIFWRIVTLILFRERGIVINRFNSLISNEDFRVQTSESHTESLRKLIDSLKPVGTNLNLVRLGGNSDGSYVIPLELIDTNSYLISGGIENNNKFEMELARHGVFGIQIDNSIDEPPQKSLNFKFIRRTISNRDDDENISLSTLIKEAPEAYRIIMKLDIEGSEVLALNNLTEDELNKVECLVMELHNLSAITDAKFKKTLLKLLEKLKESELVSVFVQANNGCLAYNIGGLLLPDNIELTFIKRKYTRKPSLSDIILIRGLTTKNVNRYTNLNIDHILTSGLIENERQ